ncbi:MAG TPA: hypothetical protein VHD62_16140 [Opitutaceae bacterium]|nr:hypothetical protein [Opitutaceae bacterium]
MKPAPRLFPDQAVSFLVAPKLPRQASATLGRIVSAQLRSCFSLALFFYVQTARAPQN